MYAGNPRPFDLANDTQSTDLMEDVISRELISALINFIKPIVQDCVASLKMLALAVPFVEREALPYETDNEIEGNLVSSLKAFVEETTRAQAGTPDANVADILQVAPKSREATAATPFVPKEMPSTELDTMVLSKVRAHVFNKMPIRLLAFNSEGFNVQLIDRDDIFERVYSNVCAGISKSKFQSKWVQVQKMYDIQHHAARRREAMTEMLDAVIEKSAHYAILSHTWIRDAPGDVVYGDWSMRRSNRRGFSKIAKFCDVAAQGHHITFGWVDTVCINKESSAELDESIRSMYKWYRGARVCITYLAETKGIMDAQFDSWFTRGWTLQELLASRQSVFYNTRWYRLGSTDEVDIKEMLRAAMSITMKELDLCRMGDIEDIPLSRRLQLACGRQVTREEDTSYSLMGILGVDISIAYGEGAERAFARLMRELLNSKKNVLDLLNRRYDDSSTLIPHSLELYSSRISKFDKPNGGTLLDEYQPLEPVVCTHLGVRLPLLLVPGLMAKHTMDKEYIPQGDFGGTYPFISEHGYAVKYGYNLLDSRMYSHRSGAMSPNRQSNINDRFLQDKIIATFGIFNFGVDNDANIRIPNCCAAIHLTWNGMKAGNLGPLDDVKIAPGNIASFKLTSATDNYSIPKDELAQHGMQLVSLYL